MADEAQAWLERNCLEALCGPTAPSPNGLDEFEEGSEATRTIAVHLNYPPYPWIEEAKLGMEMGRYFDAAELVDWSVPTEERAGTHTFRFYRRDAQPVRRLSLADINPEDLPY